MLSIEIDSPELEKSLRERFGNDTRSIADAFRAFVEQERIKQDVEVSISQLEAGEGVPLRDAMKEILTVYRKNWP